jgi:hypothetical protein
MNSPKKISDGHRDGVIIFLAHHKQNNPVRNG